jgi:predicted O-methyltransferase YrrM
MVRDLLVRLSRRSTAVRLAVYGRELARLRRGGGPAPELGALLRQFPAWQRTLRAGASPLGDRVPWVTYGAIDLLRRIVTPQTRVFEYGAGGSSLFFSERALEGTSVEHDPSWAAQVRDTLAAQGHARWRVLLVEPSGAATGDPADPASYLSSDPAYAGLSFQRYAEAIDPFADASLDLVLVDGRARPSCAAHAVPKVAPGGWLILDNAERPHYHAVHERLAALGWSRHSFRGPSPYSFNFSETTAWQRP